jgi:hypothetical protein
MKENEEILKITDLVKNEIYYFESNVKWILRFDSLTEENILVNGSISESLYYGEKEAFWGQLNDAKNIRKATKKEIYWFLECEKLNKFIKYEEAMKTFIEESELYDISKLTPYPRGYNDLKRGDKAIYISHDKTSNNCKKYIPLGSIVTIKENGSNIPIISYDKYPEAIFCCNTYNLAPIPEKQKENTSLVGRYLKALVDEPEYTNFKAGDYVKIKSLRKTNAYEVTLDGRLGASPSKKDLWELMPISWSPDEEGKVNDEIPEYVKCIKGHNCSFHNKVGTIYKVENYDLKNKKLQLENFDNTISYIDFKNPISSNLTDYIISSKAEYDLQNKPKEMKKVEDLVYPDVIELESQEQLDKILKYNPRLYKSFKRYMLFGEKDAKIGWGTSTSYSDIFYNNYKFSDIIFPEETTKQYDYEVVHCTTQEEWDFACDKYNKGIYVKEQFVKYGYNTFVMSNFSGWNKKEFFLSDPLYNKSLKIYTFKKYCDKFGYTPDFIEKEEKWIPKVGEWIVALETIGDLITKNKVYQLKKLDQFGMWHLCDDGTINGYDSSKYRLAFPHEILNNQQNDQTIDIGDTVKLIYDVQLPIIGNIPTKTIFTFDIDIPEIKKDTIIELNTNLLKNIKKPIKF